LDRNAILKWGGWSKTIYFDQEKRYIYTYDKFIKNMKSDKQFKEEALPLELWVGHLGHHLHCSPSQVAMHESLKET
jgi:hypothetical protein